MKHHLSALLELKEMVTNGVKYLSISLMYISSCVNPYGVFVELIGGNTGFKIDKKKVFSVE